MAEPTPFVLQLFKNRLEQIKLELENLACDPLVLKAYRDKAIELQVEGKELAQWFRFLLGELEKMKGEGGKAVEETERLLDD